MPKNELSSGTPFPEEPSERQATPKPEADPSSKREQAEGVLMRLNGHFRKFKDAYLASMVLGQIASSALKIVETEAEHERARVTAARPDTAGASLENAPDAEVSLDAAQLAALDPEATPERVRLILNTLPKGFVEGEVASIGFEDEAKSPPESYGMMKNQVVLADADGGTRAERTVITFWRGAKEEGGVAVWGQTLIHEVAHANDWDTDRQMDVKERAALKRKVIARVMSPDRYRDDEVESIKNPDPDVELEDKAVEYWAVIVAAYLSGPTSTGDLPPTDAALVKEFIAASDPAYDVDAARGRRLNVIFDMLIEKDKTVAEVVGPSGTWLERHQGEAVDAGADSARQRLGRAELVGMLRERGTTPERQALIAELMSYHEARERLLEARGNPGNHRIYNAQNRMSDVSGRLSSALMSASDEDKEALKDINRIIEANDLVIGRHRGAKLEMAELAELFPGGVTSEANDWLSAATDWEAPPPDYGTLGTDMMVQDFTYAEEGVNE